MLAIHHFDTELRDTVWRCISHIELHLRVTVGYELGRLGSFAHLDRAVPDERAATRSSSSLESYSDPQARSMEDFTSTISAAMSGQPSVSLATEVLQVG